MIFDEYTARMRALPIEQQPDPAAADVLRATQLETARVVDRAIADVDRLSQVLEKDPRGLEREVVRTRLHQLADVAQAAGVRVSIEHHPLPTPTPGIPPRG